MPNTFTLEELTNAEKAFRAPAPPVAAETPPVEPVTAESPPAEVEGDVVVAAESTPADAADEPAASASDAPKGSARERIEELVAERNALKKYAEYLESRSAEPAKALVPAAPAAPSTEGAPSLESCQFDTDKWTQAMNAWTAKQIQTGVKQALESERQGQSAEEARAKFEQKMESFAKTTPDVKVVLGNPSLPQLHKDAAALIVSSDLGPQILYHLGKNPEKAARIARQTPAQQAQAVGRLEAELKLPKPQKQISNAPEPPTPTKGAAAPSEPKSLKDFVMAERQKLAQRRARH